MWFLPVVSLFFAACTSTNPAALGSAYPTYDPFVHTQGTAALNELAGSLVALPTRTPGPTPTLAPLTILIPTRDANAPMTTPTPDEPRTLPTPRLASSQYVVQAGDSLGSIAQAYSISVEALEQVNHLDNSSVLGVGQGLTIPAPSVGAIGSSFKIIPDSELVYGPASAPFDIAAFIQDRNGYLAGYTERVDETSTTGAQIVQRVAQDYSVNPRLLLALLDYRSKWVSSAEPAPGTADYPLGYVGPNRAGLYHQLAWAANQLNRGFYLWRANAIGNWVLGDGSIVPIDPTINAGTAGLQSFFSVLDSRKSWDTDVSVSPDGFFAAYFFMFGNPFDLAIEPLVPLGLSQPNLRWPFEPGTKWAFTGGPHAGWDSGSAWAALDFAPSDVMGCTISQEWVTAATDGYIVRAGNGAVIEDLDGDGYEQTGWDILYMHIAAQDRVQPQTYVYAGDRIGHPSCEGGVANAAHLHFARKYNGEWIAADGTVPFTLSGYASSGNGTEYDGFLRRGSSVLEAAEGTTDSNQIIP
ncbi:MAG TPA: LysM peptidoglycan-binding domain-containing M23 family metallopeptidase [Anaerolineales bacterium]